MQGTICTTYTTSKNIHIIGAVRPNNNAEMCKYTIFSFILIALILQIVLQVSNMIVETDNIIGKFTNRMEIAKIKL